MKHYASCFALFAGLCLAQIQDAGVEGHPGPLGPPNCPSGSTTGPPVPTQTNVVPLPSRPLDNIISKQYQREIKPLRLALDTWLHKLELQELALAIRLVTAAQLDEQAKSMNLVGTPCAMSQWDASKGIGEIDVLRSDEYAKRPKCAAPRDIAADQANSTIHEVLHLVFSLEASEETKVAAIADLIQPRTRKK